MALPPKAKPQNPKGPTPGIFRHLLPHGKTTLIGLEQSDVTQTKILILLYKYFTAKPQ